MQESALLSTTQYPLSDTQLGVGLTSSCAVAGRVSSQRINPALMASIVFFMSRIYMSLGLKNGKMDQHDLPAPILPE
jgi:hypothetical protein